MKSIIIILCFLGIWSELFADSATAKDSVVKTFPVVPVTAERNVSKRGTEYYPAKLIAKEEIAKYGARQLSEALSFTPGLFIRSYGGLGGMKTASLRSSSTSQTLIMIDGISINSSQNSTVDLSNIPSAMINSIEIFRGGSSALFGANALGGAINIITVDANQKNSISGSLSLGSFGEKTADLMLNNKIGNVLLSSSYSYENSAGDYPFRIVENSFKMDGVRDNSDFKSHFLTLGTNSSDFSSSFSSRAFVRFSDRGIPGFVVPETFAAQAIQRLAEKEANVFLNYFRKYSSYGSVSASARLAISDYDYHSDNIFGTANIGINERFISRSISTDVIYSPPENPIIDEAELTAAYANLNGNKLNQADNGFVSRSNISISIAKDQEIARNDYLALRSGAHIRWDAYSGFGSAFSPALTLLLNCIPSATQVRAFVSGNFRPPSFNELYYLNFGTRDLKPENSLSANFGITQSIGDFLRFSAEAFVSSTSNQIVAVPQSQIIWRAENLSSVLTRGLESEIFCTPFKGATFNLAYTLQSAVDMSSNPDTRGKQIIYTPKELCSAFLEYSFMGISLIPSLDYTGYRYYQPDNAISSLMPSYVLFNAAIAYKFSFNSWNVNLRIESRNITDQSYSIIRLYPMPQRMLILRLSIKN